jgi:hypothetical protein
MALLARRLKAGQTVDNTRVNESPNSSAPIRRAQASQRSREGPDLMMRICAAMAQKERELISEWTKAALAAAEARGARLGGDSGYRPADGPDSAAAALRGHGAGGAPPVVGGGRDASGWDYVAARDRAGTHE